MAEGKKKSILATVSGMTHYTLGSKRVNSKKKKHWKLRYFTINKVIE